MALSMDSDIRVIGIAADGGVGVELALRLLPDVVVVDRSMPVLDGFEAARAIASVRSDIGIVLYTGETDPRLYLDAAAAGASSVVMKDEPLERLIHEIRMVAQRQMAPHALSAGRFA